MASGLDHACISAAKNIEVQIRTAQDLAANIADNDWQTDEVREIFSALYSALRKAREDSFNAQVALGLAEPVEA